MAQRKRGSSAAPAGGGSVRGSRKVVVAPVKKSFPWGFTAGVTTLVVALGGILTYAVVNTGAAAPDPLRDADAAIAGVQVVSEELAQTHEPGPLTYPQSPSAGGPHNGQWMDCSGRAYDAEVPEENATHSLEHGAVWITYRPDLPADQVEVLKQKAESGDYRLLSPFAGDRGPVVLSAWGRQLQVDAASDPRVDEFLTAYSNGPQTPEKGATCSSPLTTTGTDPAA